MNKKIKKYPNKQTKYTMLYKNTMFLKTFSLSSGVGDKLELFKFTQQK